MSNETEIEDFIVDENVSHVEIASINFDQWILTIAVRLYRKGDQKVMGMTHVIFRDAVGFRLLDENEMLNFPWTRLHGSKSFVNVVESDGWLELEWKAGNFAHTQNMKEYIVATGNECVSIIARDKPIRV